MFPTTPNNNICELRFVSAELLVDIRVSKLREQVVFEGLDLLKAKIKLREAIQYVRTHSCEECNRTEYELRISKKIHLSEKWRDLKDY